MWFALDESILAVFQLLAIFKIHLDRLFDYLVQYLPDWFIISWFLLSISFNPRNNALPCPVSWRPTDSCCYSSLVYLKLFGNI